MSVRLIPSLSVLAAVAAAVFPAACGSADRGPQERVVRASAPPDARCFLRAGGRLPGESQDVSFFTRYRERGGELDIPAGALTKTHIVSEFAPQPSGRQEEWRLYAGAPAGLGQQWPEDILERRPRDSFLIFFRESQRGDRQRAAKCMNALIGIRNRPARE